MNGGLAALMKGSQKSNEVVASRMLALQSHQVNRVDLDINGPHVAPVFLGV